MICVKRPGMALRIGKLGSRGVYHQAKTTITYHLKKYHNTIYIAIFHTINIPYI